MTLALFWPVIAADANPTEFVSEVTEQLIHESGTELDHKLSVPQVVQIDLQLLWRE